MSFFDFHKPKMFDIKKRLGVADKGEDSNGDNAQGSCAESWVELAPSRTSLCSSVDASMIALDESNNKDSRLSPVSMQSPHVEFDNLEQVKYKLVREMLPPGKNTDWIWDWSSRPEAIPPKCVRMHQYGSNLTTPPNSPAPELANHYPHDDFKPLSMRVVVGFIVSNIVTFFIGAAIGFIVCKRVVIKQRDF